MLQDLNREVVTWLGYLQRGSVLLQLAIVVSTVRVEKRSRWTRRLNSEVFSSFAELAAPLLLILLGAAIKALGFPVAWCSTWPHSGCCGGCSNPSTC